MTGRERERMGGFRPIWGEMGSGTGKLTITDVAADLLQKVHQFDENFLRRTTYHGTAL